MRNGNGYNDLFENMPLRLMMLVEVRPKALKNYDAMPEEQRKRADDAAHSAEDRMVKEELIDRIERGEF